MLQVAELDLDGTTLKCNRDRYVVWSKASPDEGAAADSPETATATATATGGDEASARREVDGDRDLGTGSFGTDNSSLLNPGLPRAPSFGTVLSYRSKVIPWWKVQGEEAPPPSASLSRRSGV